MVRSVDLGVAVHAGFRRRDIRERRLLDRGVAVPAVDPDAADVVRMAELDGLLDEVVLTGVIARQMQHADHTAQHQREEDHREDAEP